VKLLVVSPENPSCSLLHHSRSFRLCDSLEILINSPCTLRVSPSVSFSSQYLSLFLFSTTFPRSLFFTNLPRNFVFPSCNLQSLSSYSDSNLSSIHRRVDDLLIQSNLDSLLSYTRLQQVRSLLSSPALCFYSILLYTNLIHRLGSSPSQLIITTSPLPQDLCRILSSFSILQHLHTYLPHLII
jgi:hypothetical protein